MPNKSNDMPHNLEAEQSLLGCILLDVDVQNEVLTQLKENDFYSESHKLIFNAMQEVYSKNVTLDLVTLIDSLEKSGNLAGVGGVDYITELTNVLPSTANYMSYYDIVKRDGLFRSLIKSSSEIIKNTKESNDTRSALSFAEKQIFDISKSTNSDTLVKIDSIIPEVINKFDAINRDKNAFQGISTGFHKLDFLTNGLHNSDYILIAARPSFGKTSFAMNIIENVATSTDKVCAVFSLEMGKEQLTQRMICSIAEVSMSDALKGRLGAEGWNSIAQARNKLSKAKIYIDDSGAITPAEMLSKCRMIKLRHGLDLVMIDYIQLMKGSKKKYDNRTTEIGDISRDLKMMAKELNVPVIILSQLNRTVDSRPGREPQLSDLRDSGAIEQDADIVMFIHRPDKNNEKQKSNGEPVKKNVAVIKVEKHRNGPTGFFELYFKANCTKFVNLADNGAIPEMYKEQESETVRVEEYDEEVPFSDEPNYEDEESGNPDDEILG